MRSRQVFLYQHSVAPFIYYLLPTNNSYTSAATRSGGLHDIHVSKVGELSFMVPPLPVFRHQISWWTYLEFSTMSSPLSGNISPQISLMPDGPSSGKMINLLIGIHTFQSAASDETRPEAVPAATL